MFWKRCSKRDGTASDAADTAAQRYTVCRGTRPRNGNQVSEGRELRLKRRHVRVLRGAPRKPRITIFDECPPRVSKNFTLGLGRPRDCDERNSANQRVDVFGLN